MKATGEVMAIDRTFGAALNKALRGLEQAGAGPLGEDPSVAPTFDYLAAVYAGGDGPDDEDAADDVVDPLDRRARRRVREHPLRAALRGPDRARASSWSRPTRGCGGSSALLRRGVPRRRSARRRASRHGSSPRWAATSGWRPTCVRPGRGSSTPRTRTARRAPRDRQAGGLRRPRPRGAGRGAGRARSATRRGGARPRARVRDGRHLRRGVRGRDAVLLLDLRVGRVAARGPARPAARRAGHRQRPGADRAGDRVRLLRRPGRRRPPPRGLERGDGQLQPGDRLDRLRRLDPRCTSSRSTRRACSSSRSTRRDRAARSGTTGRCCPAVVAFGGQTPLNLAAPLAAAGVPLLGSTSRRSTRPRSGRGSRRSSTASASRSPRAAWRESIEEALTLAERIGYPVIVRPSFVIGGLAIDFAYSPEDLARHLAAAAVVDPDRPVRIDRFLEGIEVDVDAMCDGEAACSSRGCSSTSSAPASTRATRSACSRRSTSPRATRT